MNSLIFLENRFLQRLLHKALWAMLLPLCAVWSLAQVAADRQRGELGSATSQNVVELPTQWEGAALRPLALSEVELRFAARFPGSVVRMTDDKQVLVLRTVTKPTRMLHPATDCYKGLGYRIHDEQLEARADHTRWRCFVAQRKGKSVRVCERIEDAQGQGFTDTSSWYWASISGQSRGPWKAITVATPI